jgi:hypothetical protein
MFAYNREEVHTSEEPGRNVAGRRASLANIDDIRNNPS